MATATATSSRSARNVIAEAACRARQQGLCPGGLSARGCWIGDILSPRTATSHRRISILGATGSIGVNTLDVIRHMGGREAFDVVAVTGSANATLLARQAREAGAQIAVTADERLYGQLKDLLAGSGIEAAAGREALIEAAAIPADITMAAIVGMAGLEPTLAAVANGGTIALANKECLVSAGGLFIDAVHGAGGTLLPVDSEHNAIFQVLEADRKQAVERVILTASGGPFRTFSREQMESVTVETARAHPNWSMGLKISIDSASMFNKALEMIEARYLFDLAPGQIEVIVHPQSIVHSMVGYRDGSILAQLGPSDMRTAIGYCLGWPFRPDLPVERLDFAKLARLEFEAPDQARFPALRLARQALEAGGLSGAVLNGAKETALDAFIAGRAGFLEMAEMVERVMDQMADLPEARTLDDVIAADGEARKRAAAMIP
ncbi:MAG: 1-deoxy-D-xylulose-5-phosphate reductoisomerase [Notoacmeibacter sp.]|nr:1-deoxy-D-xylulose-5-phosphate reductoisomerase [Notoacmeibacter sp.]